MSTLWPTCLTATTGAPVITRWKSVRRVKVSPSRLARATTRVLSSFRQSSSGGIPSQDLPLITACYNRAVTSGVQPEIHELLALDTDAGTRLDRFAAAHRPELSRSRVQGLIDG